MAKKPSKTKAPLSEGEVDILNVVWASPGVTSTEVWERLKKKGAVDRTTVATRVRTMFDKGLLTAVDEGVPRRYAAGVPKKVAVEWSLRDLIRRFFGGKNRPMLNAFISENTELSESVKKELLEELAKFDEPDPPERPNRERS